MVKESIILIKKQNRHWIVVIMDDLLSDQEIMDLVDISYKKSNE